LGRFSRQAGLRAGPLLGVFDEHARPRTRQGAADEIFFGQKPVLMVVEPDSQCWLSGRLFASRDGEQWAQERRRLPALEHLVRDGGKGLANGLACVNRQRQQDERALISDQLDHFHTLREGRRALRKAQAQAEHAWTQAEQADRKEAQQGRQGQARTGYATQAVLKWQKAEKAFHQWEDAEHAFEQIRQALRPFTSQGELNTRQKAEQAVQAVLPQLPGEHWDKFAPPPCTRSSRRSGSRPRPAHWTCSVRPRPGARGQTPGFAGSSTLFFPGVRCLWGAGQLLD
jgi:hypothetical protein